MNKSIRSYLEAKANATYWAAEEKKRKAAAVTALMEGSAERTDCGVRYTVTDPRTKAVVTLNHTVVKGSIDWQAYAMSIGGTQEKAEEFRKSSTTRDTITQK